MKGALAKPRSDDLSYFNARVRAMRGALLKRTDYEQLLRLPSAAALAERLKSTGYGPHILAASSRLKDPKEAVSSALLADLSETFSQLWKITPSGAVTLLKAVFSNWEVFDLKTLARGLSRGVKREEIKAALIPAGEFDAASLNALLTSKDLPDLVAFLDTWGSPYGAALRPGLKEYQRSGRIVEMELGAELHTHKLLLAALEGGHADSRIMRSWLSLKADLQNALTLFKTAGEGYTVEAVSGFFLDGGLMKRYVFMDLASLKGKEELLSALKDAAPSEVRKAIGRAGGDPMLLEEAAEDEMKERLRALSIIDPLSIALPASYMYMKVREIKNLRLIALGADFGIPYEEMSRLVIFPV